MSGKNRKILLLYLSNENTKKYNYKNKESINFEELNNTDNEDVEKGKQNKLLTKILNIDVVTLYLKKTEINLKYFLFVSCLVYLCKYKRVYFILISKLFFTHLIVISLCAQKKSKKYPQR